MFLKRNRARLAGKTYESILLVQGKRVPAKRPAGRPRADSAPPKSVVVHETLANLSRLPAKLIEVIDAFCKDPQANLGPVPAASPDQVRVENARRDEDLEMGPCYGVLAGLHGLARELDRRMAPLGLTVEDAIDRLKGVRLVRLGQAGLGLWRLPGRHPAAQTEVLEALPKLPAPVLSLGKANVRRLRNPRRGRSNQ